MARSIAALACALALLGCVERKFLVRTDPPGATVALNRAEPLAQATPVEVPFEHYGTYHVRLTLDGFADFEGAADVAAPWWGYPPFDVFTDILWPFTIHDRREMVVTLVPKAEPPTLEEARARHAGVIGRGESMRESVGGRAPAGAK